MGFWASFANVWKDCSFYLKISAEIWSTVLQMGVPEIDMQTIDNLGRTLIDVARYCYHFFSIEVLYFSESGWNNVWQTFSTDCIYRDSHPLLVPVLQKKKCSKSGKKISKERSREISWSVLILYLCICKTQIQLIMLSFQVERWPGYRRPSQLHWGTLFKSHKWKEKESEEKCEIKIQNIHVYFSLYYV